MSITLKQLMIAGASVVLLAGCASTDDKGRSESVSPTQASAVDAGKAEKDAAAEAARAAEAAQAAKTAEAARAADAARAAEAARVATFSAKGLFDFNKSALRPDARASLDKNVIMNRGALKMVTSVSISGHACRIGSDDYNQKLSEKRAEAVKAYLVGKGIPANNVSSQGLGEKQPAADAPACADSLPRAKLIACLNPHRRVEVEVVGKPN